MTRYQQFFGAAPRGWGLSLGLLWLAFAADPYIQLPPIHNNLFLGRAVLLGCGILSGALSMWTHFSLPPLSRGTRLVTTGAFRKLRHPIYASFLILFFGFAFWMDRWIFVAWAVLEIPLWHFSVLREEQMMREDFPAYADYCRHTSRFIPGLW